MLVKGSIYCTQDWNQIFIFGELKEEEIQIKLLEFNQDLIHRNTDKPS